MEIAVSKQEKVEHHFSGVRYYVSLSHPEQSELHSEVPGRV